MASINDKKQYKSYSAVIGGKDIPSHDFKTMLECSDADMLSIEHQWNEIERFNSEVSQHNHALRAAILTDAREFFARAGIPTEIKGKKTRPSKAFCTVMMEVDDKLLSSIPSRIPSLKPIRYNGREYWSNETTVSGILRNVKAKLQREAHADNQRQLEIAKAGALAAKYGISLDDTDLVCKVTEADKQEWILQNCPDGTEMDHSSCDECSKWTIGERRCHCGHRRMYLQVEGSIGNWISYPMAD